MAKIQNATLNAGKDGEQKELLFLACSDATWYMVS
jgi:hypothetical protein